MAIQTIDEFAKHLSPSVKKALNDASVGSTLGRKKCLAAAYPEEGRVTRLKGLSRLKIKECDRLEATYALLSALGADIRREGDDLIIKGVKKLRGGAAVSSYRDHRMAMSAAIAALGFLFVSDICGRFGRRKIGFLLAPASMALLIAIYKIAS